MRCYNWISYFLFCFLSYFSCRLSLGFCFSNRWLLAGSTLNASLDSLSVSCFSVRTFRALTLFRFFISSSHEWISVSCGKYSKGVETYQMWVGKSLWASLASPHVRFESLLNPHRPSPEERGSWIVRSRFNFKIVHHPSLPERASWITNISCKLSEWGLNPPHHTILRFIPLVHKPKPFRQPCFFNQSAF